MNRRAWLSLIRKLEREAEKYLRAYAREQQKNKRQAKLIAALKKQIRWLQRRRT